MEKISRTPRTEAILTLSKWQTRDGYINLVLDGALSRSKLSGADRSLFTALVYGVCERALTLDAEIKALTGRDTSKFDAETLAALRTGLYQILFMDKIPPHAAVNETVSAAPARSRGLVNAVLRRALREGANLHIPERKDGEITYLSLKHSLPEWIVASWTHDYGDDAEPLCEAANRRPPVTLRVNTLKTDTQSLLDALSGSGVACRQNALCSDMIDIDSGFAVTDLYGWDEGLWFVQDAASRVCTLALGALPGETVIDVCSAPGGKSFSAAIDMKNEGVIYAFDLHANKSGLIEKGARRLGVDIIKASARDGRCPDETLLGHADRVICDVPCSGLGVIAKKPDIRYKNEEDASRLCDVQRAILDASAAYVKRGGVLVYSTCTLRRDENERIARQFLTDHGDFEPMPFSAAGIEVDDGMITLMPHKHGTDGFFVAKFKRK